ncbi:LysR family transcriptional regulator [Loktanella sp. D2R18]|uniref:LysR family transcriptional regulator n=1 Tax=Rhodobacterales TaxID=204455 RepID=UPI000DEB130F|nr:MULTISPECIES: LysR family transcriptional regulator [Rhodobacterales]MDO6592132.1 LysR family transcriptional regulator [Yoonia sp. 1_MG-2023]RBW42713.1 LysR family transcriptional regulator [Loktanella sp. D2R18]
MSRPPTSKDLSLKWLELFQTCARKGSLQATARETGLSISTVSHHLRSLEGHLGIDLFDHTRRPMVLTPKGHVFLRNIDDALLSIRKAKAEASSGNITEASYLRVGSIEDLDSDIAPELAVFLSRRMPGCDFLYHTGTSGNITEMLHNRQLDIGISIRPSEHLGDLQDRPLFRDPFVVVLPAHAEFSVSEVLAGTGTFPFLQFSSELIIAQQIKSQLSRLGVTLPNRFECGNHQTLMAMVASGAGWTITTPLLFARARQFQPKLRMYKFPGKSFSRTLSLITTPDCSRSVVDLVEGQLRTLIQGHVIAPFSVTTPWLRDQVLLIDQ